MTYLALTASLLNVAFVLLVNTDSEDDVSVWLSAVDIRRLASTHLASYVTTWLPLGGTRASHVTLT